MNEVNPQDLVRFTFSELVDRKAIERDFLGQIGTTVPFRDHPFALDLFRPDMENPSSEGLGCVHLVAYPGATDTSVDSLLVVLRWVLMSLADNPASGCVLRIIRGEYERDHRHPDKYIHWLWFEVGSIFDHFFCGGCNDFSGAGGSGGRQLEKIFKTLAQLPGVTLEDVTVPVAIAERVRKEIDDAYEAHAAKMENVG